MTYLQIQFVAQELHNWVATIAASNSTEKRKPEDYQRIFWGFNIP